MVCGRVRTPWLACGGGRTEKLVFFSLSGDRIPSPDFRKSHNPDSTLPPIRCREAALLYCPPHGLTTLSLLGMAPPLP